MLTLSNLPPWSIDYSVNIEPAVVRSQESGFTAQKKRSHRYIMTADVSRRLVGIQLPYFEYFLTQLINYGQDQFIDYYADGGGLQQGIIRIVGGEYEVQTSLRTHVVNCQIEVFRG